MTDNGPRPVDAELIAAFVDRRLPEEERQALLERLDQDEAFYQVFVDTVRFREQAEDKTGTVIDHPVVRWVQRRWAVPAALAALLGLAVVTPLLLFGGRPLSGAKLARSLAGSGGLDDLSDDWFDQGWSVTRGISKIGKEADKAFRLGVRIVDLDVALRLGRSSDARILTYRINALLDQVELSQDLQAHYLVVRELIEEESDFTRTLRLTGSTDALVGQRFPEFEYAYDFGKWAEAGKLAARSENTALLRSRLFRRTLNDLRGHDWEEGVTGNLTAIAEMLDQPARQMDLKRLREAFTAIIDES